MKIIFNDKILYLSDILTKQNFGRRITNLLIQVSTNIILNNCTTVCVSMYVSVDTSNNTPHT